VKTVKRICIMAREKEMRNEYFEIFSCGNSGRELVGRSGAAASHKQSSGARQTVQHRFCGYGQPVWGTSFAGVPKSLKRLLFALTLC